MWARFGNTSVSWRYSRPAADASGNDYLIGQKWVSISQVKYGLMGELFRMVSARPSLKDDPIFRANDMEVADPSVGNAIHVAFDELSELLRVLAKRRSNRPCIQGLQRHARLPV